VLDVGCGPADIPIRFARRYATCHVLGVDASEPMIRLGQEAVQRAGLGERITLRCERFEAMPGANVFDAALSNSLLHHLPNPLQFWHKLRQLVKPGAPVLVMDLLRPDSREEAQAIVDRYAATEPDILRRDFYNSLMAAYTEDEVTSHLARMNLTRLLIVPETYASGPILPAALLDDRFDIPVDHEFRLERSRRSGAARPAQKIQINDGESDTRGADG
jgi:cyclopropane fatty-acyl-phospholipid synthase-like methyltransferase